MLNIVADADIRSVGDALSELADLHLVPGRGISREHLARADCLIVRSITRVDRSLLEGTPVRWVGTATSGLDHVDTDYLTERGILFRHAGGANANAVVEYVFAALAHWAAVTGRDPFSCRYGIVGAGHVGGLLASRLLRLGLETLVCDPLLPPARRDALDSDGIRLVSFDEALKSDVISLHVPLSHDGPHATFHLLNHEVLATLRPGAVLLNTARGAVVDNGSLGRLLADRQDLTAILDVWEAEPGLDADLVERTFLATPHIAGHSLEAKLNATRQLCEGLCEDFELDPAGLRRRIEQGYLAPMAMTKIALAPKDRFCDGVLSRAFNVEEIDSWLRSSVTQQGAGPGVFDSVRMRLSHRREFSAYELGSNALSEEQQRLLALLGFSFSRR